MAYTSVQQGVIRGAAMAAVLSTLTLLGCILSQHSVPEDPIRAWLAWNLPKAACLSACVGKLANQRFYSPADIAGSGLTQGTPQAKLLQAILQNTLEQLVLAVAVHGAWAALMPGLWQSVVPAASMLFLVGRVLFWKGYTAGAGGRALGFGLTFYPTILMLLTMCLYVVATAAWPSTRAWRA